MTLVKRCYILVVLSLQTKLWEDSITYIAHPKPKIEKAMKAFMTSTLEEEAVLGISMLRQVQQQVEGARS